MKRIWKSTFAAAALAAALLLAGCGGAPSAPSSAAPAPASSAAGAAGGESPAASAPDSTSQPAAPDRPATASLTFSVEGMEESVPATLFAGEGYSLYLPDGQWTHLLQGKHAAGDFAADLFAAEANDAVTLIIQPSYEGLFGGEFTLEQAYDALLSEGYSQSDDNDHFFTQSAEGTVTCQYVTESGGLVWYVAWMYPDTPECWEGWGTRLPQIAATFEAQPGYAGALRALPPQA